MGLSLNEAPKLALAVPGDPVCAKRNKFKPGRENCKSDDCARRNASRSVHMLEADPQVIPAGDQRESRRSP